MRVPHSDTFLSELWLALGTAAWLCMVPLLLRVYSLPDLLALVRRVPDWWGKTEQLETERAFHIAIRVSDLRPFRSWPFPKACVRQSFALAFALSQMGRPFVVHFGVRKEGQTLWGHSWISLEPGHSRKEPGAFNAVYSYSFEAR